MAQDTTPALVLYVGDGSQTRFEVPFDKGAYGEIKVAFVRRGLTDYTYNPDTYTVDGYLYAWNGGVYTKTETVDTDTPLYDKNGEATGDNWTEGMYREPKNDIFTQAVVEWTGDTLTTNDVICIVRDTVKDQPYTYPNNQKHIERALDNLARQIQELQLTADNALKVDPSWNYTMDDENKMDPITWLQTIVRSKGQTLRELRVDNGYIAYTADDPDSASKTWEVLAGVKTGNAGVISHFREYQQTIDNITKKLLQYSVDGGSSWSTVSNVVAFEDILGTPTDNAALGAALDAKQDVIADLEDIRSGATAGATAVQLGDLATVATSGSYNDLSDKPTIPTVNNATITITQGGVTKGSFSLNQTSGETIALDAGGSGGGAVDSVNGKTGVVVLTASDVNALPDSTTIPDAQIQSDWNQSDNTKLDYIKNKPSIPAAQVNSDWNAASGVAQILNKPTIPTVNDSTITITQGGVTKGTFTTNQGSASTIALDAGGTTTGQSIDAEIVGTLTIADNSIVSGFSNNDYLQLPGVFDFGRASNSSFEIGGSFTTSETLGTTHIVSGAISIRIYSENNPKLRVNVNDQNITGTTDLSDSTKYYMKVEYDGTDYKIWLSTDGTNYSLDVSVAATSSLSNNSWIRLGQGTAPTIQSIDLADWYIKKNGIMVWQGMDAPGLHQRAAKGHEVIAFQAPKAGNNYTWYRKYADGWIEQGGIVTSTTDADVTVTYPVAFNDTNYTLVFGVITQNDNASGLQWSGAKTMSASGFTAHVTDTVRKNWHASGMAA